MILGINKLGNYIHNEYKKGYLASVIKGIKLGSTVAHKLNQGCAGGGCNCRPLPFLVTFWADKK